LINRLLGTPNELRRLVSNFDGLIILKTSK
jgi:hypothetical protein